MKQPRKRVLRDPSILFICDRKLCKGCSHECRHTLDVDHARNFNPELGVDGILTFVENPSVSIQWRPIIKVGDLPREKDDVLLTLQIDWCMITKDSSKDVDIGYFDPDQGSIPVVIDGEKVGYFVTTNDWNEGQPIKIIAWASLPEAYKEN